MTFAPLHITCSREQAKRDESRGLATSFHQSLLATLFDAVFAVDLNRRVTFWSSGAEDLTGYSAHEALGRTCNQDFLMHLDQSNCPMCTNACPFSPSLDKGENSECEASLRHKDGHRVMVHIRAAPVRDAGGAITGAIQVFRDLSRMKAIERRATELEQLAFRDFLTGMPNRRYTDHKVQQAIDERNRFGRSYGLAMIDLDGFKKINDRYGHLAGDALLRAISSNLQMCLRSNDIVGRWGGEEFLVVAVDATPQKIAELAERCRATISDCIVSWNGNLLRVSGSVGATLVREGDTPITAVHRADTLMYTSKKRGGNCVSLEAVQQ